VSCCRWMFVIAGLFLWPGRGSTMDYDVTIDGRSIAVRAIDQDGVVYVELYPFCAETGAEVKPIPGEDQLSVCRGDLCIPLAAGDLLEMAAAFVRLDHIASPLDFAWRIDGARVIVETEAGGRWTRGGGLPSRVRTSRPLYRRKGSAYGLCGEADRLLYVGFPVRVSWSATRVEAILRDPGRSG